MFLELFRTFFMIGFVSFGGGYAMIPLMEREIVDNHAWMTGPEFTEAIAVAGMSPGPIAANSAIFVGYQVGGFWGSVFSALGMVLPSLIVILIIARIFYRVRGSHTVKSAFYGLRPIITGLVVYAAIRFALHNGVFSFHFTWHMLSLLLISVLSFAALSMLRWHPIVVIALAGVVGAVLYG